MIQVGSRWWSGDKRTVVVLSNPEIQGQRWVHYRLENLESHLPEEFSCYEESFRLRFTELPA